ncbi:SRPBCC family protein [Streptomyces albus]|uniref:SRPBCC family protein n=1 Tax=Streptomyces albus TaxID=1888 RepID=UPI001F09EFF7|nr:SRPBCC family protein [Streptomyces albus]
MQLSNTVLVKAPPEEVFSLVNDVERVVSCMPGAALEGRDGDAWLGGVTVKVGPVSASYRGTVRFVRVDPEALTLRVQARGADTHGSGDAEAEVALAVVPADGGAELRLETDLLIRGKIAQFGKGAVAAVSDRLLAQFARNLGALLDQDRTGQGPPDAGTATAQAAATAPRAAAAAVRPAPPLPPPCGRRPRTRRGPRRPRWTVCRCWPARRWPSTRPWSAPSPSACSRAGCSAGP